LAAVVGRERERGGWASTVPITPNEKSRLRELPALSKTKTAGGQALPFPCAADRSNPRREKSPVESTSEIFELAVFYPRPDS